MPTVMHKVGFELWTVTNMHPTKIEFLLTKILITQDFIYKYRKQTCIT